MRQGQAETSLLIQYGRELGLDEAVPEYRFAREVGRQFRADIGYPKERLLIEIEGGIWNRGAHVRGKHYESDCEKYSLAACLGFYVLRFTYDMIRDGRAYRLMKLFVENKLLIERKGI